MTSYHTFFASVLFAASAISANAAGLTFSGSDHSVIEVQPEKNTGLEKVYVIYNTTGVNAVYHTSSPSIRWTRYSNLGGGYAEEVEGVERTDGGFILRNIAGDMGYIIEDGGRQYCYWVVNYLPHTLTLSGISAAPEQECESTILNVAGSGEPIHYFTINGQQRTLEQDIKISYTTQEWDSEAKEFRYVDGVKMCDSFSTSYRITPAVYCSTNFRIEGDRFLQQWGMDQTAESDSFSPKGVAAETEAVQEEKDTEGSNQITAGSDGLGGSAPADITFTAYTTEGVLHNEWQMADDPEFENITYRITEKELTYTFLHEGTVYVRYVGSNADGSCETYGETYTVNIGASELKCPNAFSPGASEGINDEWKVSYRSLIDFECWIFDRYGNELFHFTDPEQGWDGKHGGKLVKAGVYYYVIQATGSDGKKYKKSGDINILRYKTFGNQGETGTE